MISFILKDLAIALPVLFWLFILELSGGRFWLTNKYFVLASISACLKLFQVFLGFLFIAPQIWILRNGHYPYPTRYIFEPHDSPAIGDAMYASREAAFTLSYPAWLAMYIRAVMWGARNPAYGWDYLCGFTLDTSRTYKQTGNPNVDIGLQATIGTLTNFVTQENGDCFDWKRCGTWNSNYGFMVRLGWAVNSFDVGYRANLVIDIRPLIKLP